MVFAPTLRRGYIPTGRRQYTLPPWLWRDLTRSMLTGERRSVGADAERVLDAWPLPPLIEGSEHIPDYGPTVIIANHYQRRGLWIGFAGGIIAREVRRKRADRASVHFAVIADLRLRGFAVPGSATMLGRVAHAWDMVALPTDPRAVTARAAALRRFVGLAAPAPRGRAEPVVLFPEGEEGNTSGLREALAGTGTLLHMLARAGAPVVPAAVWESGGRLVARFGPAAALIAPAGLAGDERDAWVRTEAMHAIAALLPTRLRGVYCIRRHPSQSLQAIGER